MTVPGKIQGIGMGFAYSSGLAIMLLLLGFAPAAAQEAENPEEIVQLKKKVAAHESLIQEQAALIQDLLQRVEAMEASQVRTREQVGAVSQAIASEKADREEGDETLTAMRGDLDQTSEKLNKLPHVGGYFDFEFFDDDRSNSPAAFRQHHVTLFLSQEYGKVRWFSEVEFEFGTLYKGDGGTNLTTARGEVKVEQGWGEYTFSDGLTARGGLILTPGYWNVHHWPNLVLSTRRPLMVREIYPESFTGVMGHGNKFWGDFGLNYNVYVSNGESLFSTKVDDNGDKAVGGRFSFQLPTRSFDTFDVGISGYTDGPSGAERTGTWGLDAQIRKGRFELLTEFATRNAAEDRTGFYLQPSYSFTERLTPFYRYDFFDVAQVDKTNEHTLGVRFGLTLQSFLKLEYFRSNHSVSQDHNGLAAAFVVSY